MPFRLVGDEVQFIKIPSDKFFYGTSKGDRGKEYIYTRKLDFSGLDTSTLQNITISLLNIVELQNNDFFVPLSSIAPINYEMLLSYVKTSKIREFLTEVLKAGDDSFFFFPSLLHIIHTPNNTIYFSKQRPSATGLLQYGGLAASLVTPAWPLAINYFANKQYIKYQFSKGRGEKNPSILPRLTVHKVWQVSINGSEEEAYRNIAKIFDSGGP